jgi:hypothetical protein
LNTGDKISFDYPCSKSGKPKMRLGTIVTLGTNKKDNVPYCRIESKNIEVADGRPASTFRSDKVIGNVNLVSTAKGESGFILALKELQDAKK